MFLEKGVQKICSKSTGEHPCRSVISIKLQSMLPGKHAQVTQCKKYFKKVSILDRF